MTLGKFYIGWYFLLFPVSVFGQIGDETIDNAQNEYDRGNYERSLNYLNDTLNLELNDVLSIKRHWLISENYVELQYPEEVIIDNLKSILTIDPLFTDDKYNLEISSRVESRLLTIDVYPEWVVNVNASRDLIIPLVVKEPYICAECIQSDNYSFSEQGSNINVNVAYYFKKQYGFEAGIGFASSIYTRNIKGISSNDKYSVDYSERLQIIDLPLRYIIVLNKWSFRVGANYKYLFRSSASVYHSYIDDLNEPNKQVINTSDDLQKTRNRNLIFLGFNIDRKIYPAKDKSLWYLSLNLNAQIGLNSFIDEKNRLSDVNFISDTYYTDDKVSLAMIGIGLRLNYNAKYKIK